MNARDRDIHGGPNSRGLGAPWNAIAMDASGLDHTPVMTGEHRVFGENLGPGRSSRAMAITILRCSMR